MRKLAYLLNSIRLGTFAFMHNWARNFSVILILGVGTFTIVTFIAYLDRVYWGIAETTIHSQTGHLQVTVEGYESKKNVSDYGLFINNWQDIRQQIINLNIDAEFITPRLEFTGLIGNGEEKTSVFVGVGVDPTVDHRVSSFEKVEQGYPLTSSDTDKARVLLGNTLLDALELEPKDSALLLGVGPDGGLNALDVEIKGTMVSDSPAFNERFLKIPFKTAQSLLQTKAASKLVILLNNTEDTLKVATLLRKHFKETGQALEVNTWYDLNLSYMKIKKTYNRIFKFLGSAVAFLVVVTLVNLSIINFIERRDQITILIVNGFSRFRITLIFTVENLITAFMGTTTGVIAFFITFSSVNSLGGLKLSPPPGSVKEVIFKLTLPFNVLPDIYIAMIVFALLASCFSCVSISRLKISEYIRRV
ncbi:hypothetical protein OAP63_00720 [Vibrio sp.]|nr:hypothetical protein [Vibrio sp.]